MRVVYSSRYAIDIGDHVFPTSKYARVYGRMVERQVVEEEDVIEPLGATWDDLSRVHTSRYLRKIRRGELSLTELAQLEIPWSAAITENFLLMTGGTLTAARQALSAWPVVHIGGGFHHAFADHGEGFCLFNDVALAIRVLTHEGKMARAAIVDCDVHHGNGTAKIFAEDSTVFTFSMHQQNSYPMDKPPSTLDVGLPDGTCDAEYLQRLADALPVVMAHGPELLFYLAGADPYKRDQLGGLGLTMAGLRERDRLVLTTSEEAGVPVVVVLAGGYAYDLDNTVEIHVATVEEARGLRP